MADISKLIAGLGAAINRAVAKSKAVDQKIEAIRAAGYDIAVIVDAIIMYQPPPEPEPRPSPFDDHGITVSAEDLSKIIALDPPADANL